MIILITEELKGICYTIAKEQKTALERKEVEADDMVRSPSFEGGYDATEHAFCFSYYDAKKPEFWFQLTLDEVNEIAAGRNVIITAAAK